MKIKQLASYIILSFISMVIFLEMRRFDFQEIKPNINLKLYENKILISWQYGDDIYVIEDLYGKILYKSKLAYRTYYGWFINK